MPSWLTKTFQAISQVVEPEPVPFEISCYCGETFKGERTQHSQIIQCRTCGERLFLFPANVYPQPRKRTASKREIDKKQDHSAKKQNTKQKANATLEIGQQETEAVQKVSLPTSSESIPIPRRKLVTPLRLVIISIGFVVVLTSWWLIHSYRQDQATETLRLSAEAGEVALEEDNLILAEKEFGKAARATHILKRDDRQSHYVQQMHKELEVVNHLSRLSLFELVADLESKYDKEHPEVWEKHFQKHYQDNWVIIEANTQRENKISYSLLLDRQKNKEEDKEVEPEDDESKEGVAPQRYVIHSPLEIQGVPLVLNVELATLDKLPFVDSTETILFAGQLRRCELLESPDPAWVIDFVPQTTLLWSNDKLLRAAGFPDANPDQKERINKVLDRQTQLLEEHE